MAQKSDEVRKRINGWIKKMEILIIFFSLQTANAVQQVKWIEEVERCKAA